MVGMILIGIGHICFALMDVTQSFYIFVTLGIIARIVEGVGFNFSAISFYQYANITYRKEIEFKDFYVNLIVTLENNMYLLGTAFSSFLYGLVMNYSFPYTIMAIINFFMCFVSLFFLCGGKKKTRNGDDPMINADAVSMDT